MEGENCRGPDNPDHLAKDQLLSLFSLCHNFLKAHLQAICGLSIVTETTTVDDLDGIIKHRLMPISPTFHNITVIIDDAGFWLQMN